LKRLGFAKEKRLVKNSEFKTVMSRRRRFSDGLLVLFVAENDCGFARLGVSVSKSCGPAVVRNHWKRLLREVFRCSQEQIPSGFDYLLMVSPDWTKRLDSSTGSEKKPTFEMVTSSFLKLVSGAFDSGVQKQ